MAEGECLIAHSVHACNLVCNVLLAWCGRSFKGTLWKRHLGVPPFDVRRHLLELHNGRDIIVADRYHDGSDKYDYADLLISSRFGLVPRGGGLHSYRFIEVLAAGAIPVVLADDWVIPFQEVVDPSA